MSNQNRKKPPSGNEIAKYWHSKLNQKNEDGTYFFPKDFDLYEPICFGCNGWSTDNKDPENWDTSGLEKAHIIPFSLGGENEPHNFLLLCRHCHFAFDNEVCITEIKEFNEVCDWLIKRPERKRQILDTIIQQHIKRNNLNEKRFKIALKKFYSKNNYIDRTKSLEEWFARICKGAECLYEFIGEQNDYN